MEVNSTQHSMEQARIARCRLKRKKTALINPLDNMSFKMNFGLANSPATPQRIMDKVFHRCRSHCYLVVDDFIVTSKTIENQHDNLAGTLNALRAYN